MSVKNMSCFYQLSSKGKENCLFLRKFRTYVFSIEKGWLSFHINCLNVAHNRVYRKHPPGKLPGN